MTFLIFELVASFLPSDVSEKCPISVFFLIRVSFNVSLSFSSKCKTSFASLILPSLDSALPVRLLCLVQALQYHLVFIYPP